MMKCACAAAKTTPRSGFLSVKKILTLVWFYAIIFNWCWNRRSQQLSVPRDKAFDS